MASSFLNKKAQEQRNKRNQSSGSSGKASSFLNKKAQEQREAREAKSTAASNALAANNPGYVAAQKYGNGKTGTAANKVVKGTSQQSTERKPGQTNALGGGTYNKTKLDSTLNAAVYNTAGTLANLWGTIQALDESLKGTDEYTAVGGLNKITDREGDKKKAMEANRVKSVFNTADTLMQRSAEEQEEAKEGLGKFGQGLVDFGVAGAQFAGDIAANAILPGLGTVAMGARAAGGGAYEARQAGLDLDKQLQAGVKSSAIEVITNKLFGAGSKIAYGSGIIKNQKFVNGLVNNMAKTDKGRTALKVLAAANEEGLEEVLSDVLNPIADRILNLRDSEGNYLSSWDAEQMLEDYIIGAALGAFGAGANVVSGEYKAENAQQRAYEDYQKALVNAGLAAEQGSNAQVTAAEYQKILDQSSKRGNRNLSDRETENMLNLLHIEQDAPDVSARLQSLGQSADTETVNAIVKAVNGEKLSRKEQQAFSANPYSQRVVNEMTDTEGVTSNGWYADRASGAAYTPQSTGVSAETAQQALDIARRQRAAAGAATFNPTASAQGMNAVAAARNAAGQAAVQRVAAVQNVTESIASDINVAPEVVQQVYNLKADTSPEVFKAAFKTAYTMGEQGAKETALSSIKALSPQQASIAYNIGMEKAAAAANTQEVNESGVHLRGSGQRINGQNTAGQVSGLAESTGRNTSGQAQGRPRNGAKTARNDGQEVVYNGAKQKGVRYTAGKKTESMRKAEKTAKSRGYSTVFFEGGNIKVDGGEARGIIDPDTKTVYVRTDHPDFTANQIMRHEMGHADIAEGKISLDKVREDLHERFTDAELDEIAQAYADAYEGANMTIEEAFEEICCDALGDMNVFAGTGRIDDTRYGQTLTSTKKSAERQANQGRAPPRETGAKYSYEGKNKDGIEVYETSDEVKALSRKERQKKFLEIMQNEYRGRTAKFIRNGHAYYATFDDKDVNKNIYGDKRSSNSGYNAKIKVGADGNIFELVENAKYNGSKKETGKSTKSHKQIQYWDYYVKTVQIDNQVYDLVANVRRKSTDDFVYSIQLHTNNTIKASAAQQPNQKAGVNKAANASDNSIPTTSENVNTQSSLESKQLTELRRENRALKERVEFWRGQTQRTTAKTVRNADINRLANEIISMSETDLKAKDIAPELTALGNYILNENELRFTDVSTMARRIAVNVIENATAIENTEDVQVHDELKSYLKQHKFKYDGSTEFDAIRNRYKRRIMFAKNGLDVNIAYGELRDMFGEAYFPEYNVTPADQLERIAQVLDNTAPRYVNPNDIYFNDAVTYLHNYIVDSILSDQIRQTAPTYADRADAKLAKANADKAQLAAEVKAMGKAMAQMRKQNEKRVKEAIGQEKKRAQQELKQFKEDVLQRDANRRETAERNKYKAQISKDVNTLSDWLLKPDHKNALKHIPGPLQSTVRDFIASVDFTSTSKIKGKGTVQKDMKYLENLERLHNYITDQNTGEERYSGYFDLPPTFEANLSKFINKVNALARANSGVYTINNMDSTQLKQLSDIVKTIKKTITDMNKMYQNATFQHAYDAGAADVENLQKIAKTKAFTKSIVTSKLDRRLMWTEARPAHAFQRFGKGGESIYREFTEGQSTMAFLTKEIIDFTDKLYKDNKVDVKAWEKQKHTFDFDGDKITLTTPQLMGLYELNKRPQAKQHLDAGGFKAANFKDGLKIQSDETSNGHVLTEQQLNEMFEKLTDTQKKVADEMQRFMVDKGGEWGNYVSVKRFDVEMFKDEHYYPIKVDTTETDSREVEKVDNASLYKLLNMGFTKELSPKANQAIVVYDIFDVFANHMAEMAQYRSFALPVLDSMKWFNYKERDAKGIVTASFRKEMGRAFGTDSDGRSFAEDFVKGVLQAYNGAEARGDNSLNARMLNRMNRQAVAFNTRVMIQQPSAIARAALYLDVKDLAAGLKNYTVVAAKKSIEEMHKYSGIAVWKDLGFYDVNVSRGVQELIKNSQNVVSKINEIGMKGAAWADKLTWAAMWDASKAKVKRETKLTEQDEEFFPKVVELFEDTIYNTQVVDTVMTKSAFSRDKSFGTRLLSSFMSEPMTTASLVTNQVFKMQVQRATGEKLTGSDYKQLGKVCATVAIAAVVNSALASLADAWRDDDEYATFGQKWERAFKTKLADEMMPLSYLPFGSLVWNTYKIFLDNADKRYFGLDVYGNETNIPWADMVDNLNKAMEIFKEIEEKGDDARYTKYGGYYKIAQILSQLAGIPVSNVVREAVTAYNNFSENKIRSYKPSPENAIKYAWNDGYLSDEEAMEWLQNDETMDGDAISEDEAYLRLEQWKANESSAYFKVYDAIDDGGNVKEAVDELLDHGKEEWRVKSTVANHYKEKYIKGTEAERAEIRKGLYATGLYDSVDEVLEKCRGWLKEN